MAFFKRKKKAQGVASAGTNELSVDEAPAVADGEQAPDYGPFDISQRDVSKGYVDLGPLKFPAIAGIQIQPVFSPDKTILRMNAVIGNSVMQMMVIANPKSGGAAKEVLNATKAALEEQGTKVDVREGPWGAELVAQAVVKTQDGRDAIAPTRIFAIEGNRWALRIDLAGAALSDEKAWDPVAAVISSLVVERDGAPRAPLSVIPFTLPAELTAGDQPQDDSQ
ncbi:DUF3710 domain-containing protein [uncultured Actinomyces sp.]|uniref:DUF3710 domain-containing protein n=1 Tax=uncultured Actinomyces sp. TaxID=249061 RepID=UPI002615023B|nr:DUF3710 domain-containing protein [uncultured Actinomyces sp.]